MSFLLIFIGSGIGGVLRYLMSSFVQTSSNWIFPIGTFSVNMLGSILIGFLAQVAESKGIFPGDIRLFIFVGLLGGFTTFSSFGYETMQLLRDGQIFYAVLNAVLQVVLGLLFVWTGMVLGRLV